jgi:hypothetical protein
MVRLGLFCVINDVFANYYNNTPLKQLFEKKSMHIVVTIDTEWDRVSGSAINTNNLEQIPRFQRLCSSYNIKPVYFCSYEAIQNDRFVEYITPFVNRKEVEIGAHLHPWSNPPYHTLDDQSKTFPHQYPIDVFHQKMELLTKTILNRFNRAPISYRAGKFGFVNEHIEVLNKLGYKIDSSITPFVPGPDIDRGVNFEFYKQLAPAVIGDSSFIVEIPITILPTMSQRIFNRIIVDSLRRWFRIYPKTKLTDLNKIINFANGKIPVVVFMMHSNEFDHKYNPYFQDENSVDNMFLLLESFFKKLIELNITSVTFNDLLKTEVYESLLE